MEDFFYVNLFSKSKLNVVNVSINDHLLYLCIMLLIKTSFLLPHHVDFELIRLIEFQNKANIEIIGF